MKRTLALVAALAAVCTAVACTNINFSKKTLRGSGHIVTKNIALPDYHTVRAERSVDAVIVAGGTDKITVRADDNVMDYVVITARDGVLKLTLDPAINSFSNITVEVRIPDNGRIRKLEAHSSADIKAETLISADELLLEAHSSGDIEGRFRAAKCYVEAHSSADVDIDLEATDALVEAHSSADVTLRGSARTCKAEVHSSGEIDAEHFIVEEYVADAASSGKADIYCTGTLRASASSAGKIRYAGDCRVEAHTSSAGSVSKK